MVLDKLQDTLILLNEYFGENVSPLEQDEL
jgi:hypothetical protein